MSDYVTNKQLYDELNKVNQRITPLQIAVGANVLLSAGAFGKAFGWTTVAVAQALVGLFT